MRKSDREQTPFVAEAIRTGDAPLKPAPSPMMAQYLGIKADHPDALLFYRMGDFYELFFADAVVAAKVLGITLTRRGRHDDADIPMCGVPVERHEDYLHRLIEAGHRVAICEQTEDPAEARKRGSKAVVARRVVRLITPGTLTEERLLEPTRASWLVALARTRTDDRRWMFGIAAIDLSTGSFEVGDAPLPLLSSVVARFEPREIVVPDALSQLGEIQALLDETRATVTRVGGEQSANAQRLQDWFGLGSLDGLGPLSGAEIAAAAVAVGYLEKTQCGARPNLKPPASLRNLPVMEIDSATRANLELTRTLGGTREGSLLATIDRCVTPAGSRLLAARLDGPLRDAAAIDERLREISYFVEAADRRRRARELLRSIPDFERALSRLALDRAGPRDLAAIAQGLLAATNISACVGGEPFPDPDVPPGLTALRDTIAAAPMSLAEAIAGTLDTALPLHKRDGGFVRAGVDPALDDSRKLRDDSRKVVAELQQRYGEIAGTKRLKIKHNNMLGFYAEVPQAAGEAMRQPPLNEFFIHRQTMADAARFSTVELSDLDARIAAAAEGALAREIALFDELAQAVVAASDAIARLAAELSRLDVAAALAEIAVASDWVRPEIAPTGAFLIEGGRHPVVEDALRRSGKVFVGNDCELSAGPGGGRIAVVTGPNMAGKSTYLRQNAIIAIMAQMGSFVPAKRVRIGLVDRLFSRVGAADDLARGRSTFMVEMVETAAILNRATSSSLVVLDEIGRGTATFDGLSIAWAVIEHLHEKNRSRAIFATHFHELTELSRGLNRLTNLKIRVADFQGDVVFLHEIVPGTADHSYGLQVAKLAGLPASVIKRARSLLRELESGERGLAIRLGDLPLFAAALDSGASATDGANGDAAGRETESVGSSNSLFEAIQAIDPNALSPIEALQALYRLKSLAAED